MKRGFSLVELSIVLVIIGLLTGGILAGQSLIRAGEVRASLRQLTEYSTAVQAFTLKYDALPGDLRDATRYWGIAAGATGNDATCRNASQTGPGTCNGNGDGAISAAAATAYAELFHAWKQLSNEGLISGLYTGKAGGGGATHTIPDTNVPAGPLGNSAFMFWSQGENNVNAEWFPTIAGTIIIYGATTATGAATAGIFKGAEQADIDQKLDDGLPGTGLVRSLKNNNSCVTSTDPATAAYVKSSSTLACSLLVWIKGNSV